MRASGSKSFKSKEKVMLTHLQSFPSPLGKIWLAASNAGLRGLWFEGQQHLPDFSNAKQWQRSEHRHIRVAIEQLTPYFAGQSKAFQLDQHLPLDLSHGTTFQQAVWHALLSIPFGGSTSYGAIAQKINNPAAVRAVGAAVGRNPISILVPCHRVLGKDGSLTGYAGGLERKVALLRIEGLLI
jgi:methylated-DNA-[protein]-cysteine S-methyltransferase